jgi:hypothetical protein
MWTRRDKNISDDFPQSLKMFARFPFEFLPVEFQEPYFGQLTTINEQTGEMHTTELKQEE